MAIILQFKSIMCENTDSRFETVWLILVAVRRADVEHGSKQSTKYLQAGCSFSAPTCRFQTRDKRF